MNDTPRRAAPAPVGAKAAPAPAAPVEKPKAQSSLVPPVSLPPAQPAPEPSSDLVERLCRAACRASNQNPDGFTMGKRNWEQWRDVALVHIAMNEALLQIEQEANDGN